MLAAGEDTKRDTLGLHHWQSSQPSGGRLQKRALCAEVHYFITEQEVHSLSPPMWSLF